MVNIKLKIKLIFGPSYSNVYTELIQLKANLTSKQVFILGRRTFKYKMTEAVKKITLFVLYNGKRNHMFFIHIYYS